MIARRLGFPSLNRLFTGEFASGRAQENYEAGEHFLLKPFTDVIWPIISSHAVGDSRKVIDLLRTNGTAFAIDGPNRDRPLREMIDRSKAVVQELFRRWENGSVREVLDYCQEQKLLRMPDRLLEHLRRQPRAEAYDEETFGQDKEDWLCDLFFSMKTTEVPSYYKFLSKNTVYSTQHGVKGEQYSDVLVVFDDVEAAWS